MAALSLPLLIGEIAFGGLNLYTSDPDGLRSESDEVAATLLAEQGAVSFAAAHALEFERRTALTLQRSLLTTELPAVPGYELTASYQPASSTAQVGGDWYDAFMVGEDGALAVVVGDAAGHGLEAAALMGQVRTGLRAYALEGRDPATCVQLLSHLVDASHGDSDFRFATPASYWSTRPPGCVGWPTPDTLHPSCGSRTGPSASWAGWAARPSASPSRAWSTRTSCPDRRCRSSTKPSV